MKSPLKFGHVFDESYKTFHDIGTTTLSSSSVWEPLEFSFSLSSLVGDDLDDSDLKFYVQSDNLTVEYYADFIYMVNANRLIKKTSLVTDGSFELGVNNWGKQGMNNFFSVFK